MNQKFIFKVIGTLNASAFCKYLMPLYCEKIGGINLIPIDPMFYIYEYALIMYIYNIYYIIRAY